MEWALQLLEMVYTVYGNPKMPEQPRTAGTALFLRLESHANTIMRRFYSRINNPSND